MKSIGENARASMLAGVAVAVFAAGAALAATPAQKCEQGKNKEAGKYAFCRQKAEAKFALTADAARRTSDLARCADKYTQKWPLVESKAGGDCPTTGDQAAIQAAADVYTTDIATALAGGGLSAAPQGQRLKTGQTGCWDDAGNPIACAGTGQDGELQKGLAQNYVDNGDGTITDTRTGLMWEKLSDDGSIHDKDAINTWANAFAVKIATLNGGGGFAGYTDWRLPNRSELESLVNLGAVFPAVFPAFNTGCAPACTVLTCSCTVSSSYWSSSTYQGIPSSAWFVFFNDGFVSASSKASSFLVRAVRGGS